MDILKNVLGWAAIAAASAPIWGAFLWEAWEGVVRPRLLPQTEIEALSAALLAEHGKGAEEIAFIAEDRAWRYSDSFEQGKWSRVRKALRHHLIRQNEANCTKVCGQVTDESVTQMRAADNENLLLHCHTIVLHKRQPQGR